MKSESKINMTPKVQKMYQELVALKIAPISDNSDITIDGDVNVSSVVSNIKGRQDCRFHTIVHLAKWCVPRRRSAYYRHTNNNRKILPRPFMGATLRQSSDIVNLLFCTKYTTRLLEPGKPRLQGSLRTSYIVQIAALVRCAHQPC